MSYLAIGLILLASIFVTVQRGPAGTFVFVFLPVVLMFSSIPSLAIPILPDMTSMHAVTYGVLLGMMIVGKLPSFRPHPVDGLILLLSIAATATSYANGNLWTIVSSVGAETLHWIVPYYMARLAFRDVAVRRQMAIVLAIITCIIAFAGVIEWRLKPLIVAKVLGRLHLSNAFSEFVQPRFGFFRAMSTGEHPIDFGNMGILLTALIPTLAVTSGLRLRDPRILAGTLAGAVCVLTSMSFSSFSGAIAAIGIFAALRYIRGTETLLIPGVAALLVIGVIVTGVFLELDLAKLKPEGGAEIEGSFYTRVEIIQKSYNTYGESAGLLGYGDSVSGKAMSLKSVDNSYLLFLIKRGWLTIITWMLLAVSIGAIGMRMLLGQRGVVGRLPPAALVAALIGTMISMYTVWFGFNYAVLWICIVGMAVSMRQILDERMAAVAPRGFEPIMGGRREGMDSLRGPRPLIARAADLR
jgi:hypothetical protein